MKKLLERLDRIVRPIAIPNLTVVIIVGQVLMALASAGNPAALSRGMLVWDRVIEGEVWRLITFLFVPPTTQPIFLFIILYIFYIMGTSLQNTWGMVRYNTFLWLGTGLTVAVAGLMHGEPFTGHYLEGTVFLAFATYNPNFELRLFFVLPIKIKYLAYFQAFGYGYALLVGTASTRLMVLASLGNYLIFFAPAVLERGKHFLRKKQWEAKQYHPGKAPRHTCAVCGINSNTHPKVDFRYCSKCDGQLAYCEEHLRTHEHMTESS